MFRFDNWYFLLAIPLIVFLFLFNKKKSALKFSSVKILKNSVSSKTIKHKIGRYIIGLGIVLLVVALARPQLTERSSSITQKGIDITMALDVSTSMEAVDIQPNRLEAAKSTIDNFIDKRKWDRLSLVIFAGTAYTRIPLTLDHDILRESLQEVTYKSVNQDGTAIGMAISVGLNRLKKSDTKSRIMILLTDGDNNYGSINPETASELAEELGVKIYTIGVGSDEVVFPYMKSDLNEELLQKIADKTGGKYYRAKDPQTLAEIFDEIDKLEKTEFDQDNFKQYTELAYILIIIALLLLTVGIFLDKYYYIQIP